MRLRAKLTFIIAIAFVKQMKSQEIDLPQYGAPNQSTCSNQNQPFFDFRQLNCINCLPNCQTCLSDTQCLTCQAGYFVDVNNDNCVNCSPNCQTCNIPINQCSACMIGYYLLANACLPCSNNCRTCTGPVSGACLTCNDEYYLDSADPSFNCLNKCFSNCKHCIGQNIEDCTQCSTYSFFDSNLICQSCAANQYWDTVQNICNICDVSCSQCTGPTDTQCTNCRDTTWYWNSAHNKCISCSPWLRQYFDPVSFSCIQCPVNCNKCQKIDTCEVCNPSSYMLLGVCMIACPTIYTPMTINGLQTCIIASCLSPIQFFDYQLLQCKNCQVNCLSCTSINDCFTCSSGFILDSGVCVPNNWATINTCPATQWIQLDGVTCLPCTDTLCSECIPSGMCVTCIAPNVKTLFGPSMALNKCAAQCQAGYVVVDGVCIWSNFPVSQSVINNFIPFSIQKVNLDTVGITFSKNEADVEYLITGTIPADQYFPPNNICGSNPNNYLVYDKLSSLTTVYVTVSLTEFKHCGFAYTDSTNTTLSGYIVSIYRTTQTSYIRQISFNVQNDVEIEVQSRIGDTGTTINMDLLIAALPDISTFTTAPVIISAESGQTGSVNNPIVAAIDSVLSFQVQLPADLTSSYGLVLPSFASLVNTQVVLSYRVTMDFVQTAKNTFTITVDLNQVTNMIDGIYDLSFTAGIYVLSNRRRVLTDVEQAKIELGLVIDLQTQENYNQQNPSNTNTTNQQTNGSSAVSAVITNEAASSIVNNNGPSVTYLVGLGFVCLIGISILFLAIVVIVLKRRREHKTILSSTNQRVDSLQDKPVDVSRQRLTQV